MAPKKRAASDDYDSDDGFVEKKAKTKHSSAKHSSPKDQLPGGGSLNENNEEYWELSGTRRIVLSEFKGKRMIHIREYYEKDGQTLPGKKGITLPLEQFSTLISLLPHIGSVLKGKGEVLPRPEYDIAQMEIADNDSEGTELKVKVKKEPRKKNFEETSDEEE